MMSVSNVEFVNLILDEFSKFANVENANAMSKYMRNRFQFFGIKSELRKSIQKDFLATYKLPQDDELKDLIEKLWASPQRECHYFAMEILEKPIKKADESWMPLLEKMILENSWWDTVDAVASKLIAAYLKKYSGFRSSYPEKWIASDNFWFRRTALLYQLKYKKNTDFERLKSYILHMTHEKEFFIQKAQGWALREFAKTNPEAVRNFVSENEKLLSPLTKREALKNI
jgi:3-methyladenine DNA glycosylase AlkD